MSQFTDDEIKWLIKMKTSEEIYGDPDKKAFIKLFETKVLHDELPVLHQNEDVEEALMKWKADRQKTSGGGGLIGIEMK